MKRFAKNCADGSRPIKASVMPTRELLAEEGDTWNEAVAWHKKLNEGKWIGISWPKEYGGRGAGTPAERHLP